MQRDDASDYPTATDVESDTSGSTSSFTTKKTKGDSTASSTPRRTPHNTRSIGSPSRSVKQNRRKVEDPFASPLSTNKTPTTSSFSTCTPSSRGSAVESAFKKSSMQRNTSATPTKSVTPQVKHSRVIVIIDSDDEETDMEVPESPTKCSGGQRPVSADSSFNSLFSNMSMTSSSSSIESFSHSSPPKQDAPRPVTVKDVFQAEISPNITKRKAREPSSSQPSTPSRPQLPKAAVPEVPESVSWFANSQFGTDLEPLVIAHDDEAQQLLDLNHIEWGTQYELARGVSSGSWTWDAIHAHISGLRGENIESAYKVQKIMRDGTAPDNNPTNIAVWKELDREQAAIKENRSRGLGLMGEWQGHSEWYGGQIQQLARLVKVDNAYKIILEPMEKRRSHRFARFYGSRRFLQLRIPEEIRQHENAQMKTFLLKKFILCGRVFVPFHSKDGGLYMVETDENWERTPQDWCGDQHRMPFNDFINWHNPLEVEKNYDQVISKYATRFALGLSNSAPALMFEEKNIIFIDDITSSEWPKDKKNPPADMLMTDGCGFLNHAALLRIVKTFRYENLPAGVQGRIDGSKGFWILHPNDNSDDPKIWIRTSQNKIQNRSFDRAHLIFDLLCPSRPSPPTALTQQSIINLFANGIPQETLVRLMEEGLEEEVAPLLEWDGKYAMPLLWDAINKCGSVSGSRTQRLATSLNRVLGLVGRDWGHETVEKDGVKQEFVDDSPATYTGRNKYSGAPLGMHEYAVELLQANFHPSKSEPLYDKIKYIVKTTIDASVKKYRIPVLESLGAFVVPDPLGVLKEGEIYYRFSRPRKDPRTEMLVHNLEGDVVVGRYPIRLPSDMQKVKAVDRRELDKWPDVVIISTQGKRSIASLLADGDMDGDELVVVFDPELVEPFENKSFTKPPDDLMRDFERDVERVEAFCTRAKGLSSREANEAFQEVLIGNLNEPLVGLYSMMHENAAIMHGYGSSVAVRMAYIFATLLDSSKTGRRLKPGLLKRHLGLYGTLNMDPNSPSSSPMPNILNLLQEAGHNKGQQLLERYESQRPCDRQIRDRDLCEPYKHANDYALMVYNYEQSKNKAFTDEMSRIRKHVDDSLALYQRAMGQASFHSQAKQETPSKRSRGTRKKKSDQEDLTLASARAYAEPVQDITLTRDLEQVKASYAYERSPKFAFSVAFKELCHIKAIASPDGIVSSIRIFDEGRTFSASFLRSLALCDEDPVA